MLQLDGTVPAVVGGSTGSGVGMGALGGGVAGLLLGGLLAGNGNGLFGGNNNGNNVQFDALQGQINNLSGQLASGDIQDGISRVSSEIGNVATAQASANFTTLSSINGLGRDLITNIHQTDLTQLNSFNNLSTTMLQGFNNQAMQTQNATNQIIAQGTVNAATNAANFCQLSREMATCCCEMKGAIAADGAATRALINDLATQSLRDQLAAANNKVSNNEQNQYLLNSILTHIHPVVS